jgi:hypothetical protein
LPAPPHPTTATRCTRKLCLHFPVVSRHPLLVALEPVAEALGADLVTPGSVAAGDIPLRWDGDVVGGCPGSTGRSTA